MRWIARIALFAFLATSTFAQAEDKGPRTGYYKKKMTVAEVVGEQGAAKMSSVFAPDDKISWQIYVPKNYDPSRPAGLMVFMTHKASWAGGSKKYNPVSDDHNLIWAGLYGTGDKSPLNERMLKVIMTPTMLAQEYSLDPERIYVGGFSGGAHVAMILATSKPELFKGGMFVGGAVFWGDKAPANLDLVRQNRYAFVTGSNDVALDTVRRTALAYQEAGVINTDLTVMPNQRQEMPSGRVFEQVIRYLDDNVAEE